jgi:hypothetical protein
MSSANTSSETPLSKRLWGNKVAEPMYKASRLLNMCKKDTTFGTIEGRYIVFKVAPIAGSSPTFGDALANQAPSVKVRMLVQHRTEYAVFSIQNLVIEQTRGKANAMLEALSSEMDSARTTFSRSMARTVNGNGGGAIGQLSASENTATAIITFRNELDILGLEVGMKLVFASDDGSGPSASPANIRNTGSVPDLATVVSISGTSATLSFANAGATLAAGINGITVNDYVFRPGAYMRAMTGIRGYLPDSAPTSGDSFFGLDRSTTNTDRVAGYHISGGGASKLETLERAGEEGMLRGLNGDDMVLLANPRVVRLIRQELMTARMLTEEDVTPETKVGFKAIKFLMQNGTCTILNEPDAPVSTSRLFRVSDFYLRSTDTVPKDITNNKGELLTDFTDDARQGRLGGYGNFFHENPGESIVITW